MYDYFEDVQVVVVQPLEGGDARAPVQLVDDKGNARGEITLKGGELTLPGCIKEGWRLTVNGEDRVGVKSLREDGCYKIKI